MSRQYSYDWADLAFASKKPLRQLEATFIVAPRTMSDARLTQIIKQHLLNGNVVLGISKERQVVGFEDQPQFGMLPAKNAEKLSATIAGAKIPNKLFLLHYNQKELPYILEKIVFKKVLLVNGSWRQSFHTTPAYYILAQNKIPFDFISPFCDEAEAKRAAKGYANAIKKYLQLPKQGGSYDDIEAMNIANQSAQQSFDHTFQTGAVIARKSGNKYSLVTTAYNQVVPYETFAMHNGASREQFFSPPNDLNHYDTVHAEIQGIINAGRQNEDIKGATLFVNLLPCPICSRILVLSGISEVVYQHDHSDGYAVKLLQLAGLTVRRLVI